MSKDKEIIAIIGPTATGKSQYSIELAKQNPNSVIINADAYNRYREFNIITAKPQEEEFQGIEHHLFSDKSVTENLSVDEFSQKGKTIIRDLLEGKKQPENPKTSDKQLENEQAEVKKIWAQKLGDEKKEKKQIIVVGGSGLYIKGLLEKMDFQPQDLDLRKELYEQLEEKGPEYIWESLNKVDPESAEKIGVSNPRRVIRALEVIKLTGKKYSHDLPKEEFEYPTRLLTINFPMEEIEERIKIRTDLMIEKGLVEEVKKLIDRPNFLSDTANKTIGVAEVKAYLNQEINLNQMRDLIVLHTRQLVKKQQTWFRKYSDIVELINSRTMN